MAIRLQEENIFGEVTTTIQNSDVQSLLSLNKTTNYSE